MTATSARLAALLVSLASAALARAEERPALQLQCDRELVARQGAETAARLSAGRARAVRTLRKVRSAAVDFSSMGDRTGSGVWVGEALIGVDGRVERVWTHRSPAFEPAWPEFDDLVAAAVTKWVYEPVLVDGTPTPVCIVVTTTFHWR